MLSLTGLCAAIAVSALFFILGYLVYHGGSDMNWDFFTKLPTPVGESGGGMANAIVGSGKLAAAGGADRRAHRAAGRRLPGGIWRQDRALHRALYRGHAERRAFDRHRHFCLRHGRHAGAPLFDPGRRLCPGDHDDSHRAAQHRGVPERRAARHARRRHGAGSQQVEDDFECRFARRAKRHHYRDSAVAGARGRRNRASALHRFRQPLLESRLESADRFAAGHDLHLCRRSL